MDNFSATPVNGNAGIPAIPAIPLTGANPLVQPMATNPPVWTRPPVVEPSMNAQTLPPVPNNFGTPMTPMTPMAGGYPPPAWARAPAGEIPAYSQAPQAPPVMQTGVGATMAMTPMAGMNSSPPTWTREMPAVTTPPNAGHVAIDMNGYSHPAPGTIASFGGAAGAAAGNAGPVDAVGSVSIPMDPYGQIQSMMAGYFAPYMTDANRHEMQGLIDQRAGALHAMGQTPEQIAHNMANANRYDWASTAAVGAVRSLPFAGASVAFDTVPALTAFVGPSPVRQGLVAGFGSGAFDNAGTALLGTGTQNTQWMHPDRTQLEDVMSDWVRDNAPSFWRNAGQTATAFQAYTARNGVRTVAVPTVYAAAGPAAARIADTTLSAAGGVLAGAGAYTAMRWFNQANGQDGPALFFGQRNWEALYNQLDNTTWGTQLWNGGVRTARFPLDVATGLTNAAQSLFRPAELAQTGVLGGGFAGVAAGGGAVRQAMATAGYGPVATELAGQAANTVLSAPVFVAWTTASIGAGPAAAAVAQRIQGIGRPHTALELGDPGAARYGQAGMSDEERRELEARLINSQTSTV